MHYYTFNIGDYMRDTAHLDEMEDLAYRRMLDLCYLKESPLPSSIPEIAKLIRMRTHSESIANVLQEFFVLTESGYQNSKVDTVLTKIYDKSAKAKSSAEKRWQNQQHKNANALPSNSERNADGMLPITYLPNNTLPINNVDSGESTVDFVSVQFDRFWRNYPTKKAKKPAESAFRSLVKGKKESQVRFYVDMILNYHLDCVDRGELGATALHAATLINQQRWKDNPEYFENFKREWIAENE